MNRNLAFVYQLSHKYSEYEAQARVTLELAPTDNIAKWDLSWACALQGKKNEALANLDKDIFPADKAIVLATLGVPEQALPLLDETEKRYPHGCAFCLAMGYALSSKSEKAMRLLKQSYEERDAMIVQLKTNPALDSLHSDPRFQDLMRRMNFPK